MITGWRCNNWLHNRLLCYPFFWQARTSIIKMEPEIVKILPSQIVALQLTIWGQYRANCEVAGTRYIYKTCVRDECWPVEPHTTINAEGEGGTWGHCTFFGPSLSWKPSTNNRLQ